MRENGAAHSFQFTLVTGQQASSHLALQNEKQNRVHRLLLFSNPSEIALLGIDSFDSGNTENGPFQV